VDPFSTQSGPNELFDNSSDGTADITVALTSGISAIGIGIADSDAVSITLQALAQNGSNLGSPFTIPLSTTEGAINTGDAGDAIPMTCATYGE
jgi:F0F1-type ATP synthase membrane subunit c/vacuolar-type H+-ATPase subunit K